MNTLEAIRVRIFRLKQPAFAAAIGVTQGTVSRWENGLISPTIGNLERIREAALKRSMPWDDRYFFEAPPEFTHPRTEAEAA